jgi:hypothetical protein
MEVSNRTRKARATRASFVCETSSRYCRIITAPKPSIPTFACARYLVEVWPGERAINQSPHSAAIGLTAAVAPASVRVRSYRMPLSGSLRPDGEYLVVRGDRNNWARLSRRKHSQVNLPCVRI